MGTYKNIQEYVKSKYNYKPQTCWIAHAKEVYGIKVNKAPNRKDDNNRVKPCPKDKLEHLKDAFIYFGMI